jgi:hypothetical protein
MANFFERLLPIWWWRPVTARAEQAGADAGLKPITVVTGGSDGIGLAIAKRFAAAGHVLLLVGRRPEQLTAAAAEIRALGTEVHVLALDITAADATRQLDAALSKAGGFADILVNAAGMGLSGPFGDHTREEIAALVDLNVRALTLWTHHVLPGMRRRRRGGVINLASLGGYVPGPWQAAYYASKAYVLSLSEALAAELVQEGIRVCAVAPGPVNTQFHERMDAETAAYRWLVPPLHADTVAWWTYRGFTLGLRVIVPGSINSVMSLFLKLTPHRISIPIVGLLLKPKGRETRDA